MTDLFSQLAEWSELPVSPDERAEKDRSDFPTFPTSEMKVGKQNMGQVTDIKQFPTFPTFPTGKEDHSDRVKISDDESGPDVARAIKKSAGAHEYLHEMVGKVGNPMISTKGGGKEGVNFGEKWEKWENSTGPSDWIAEFDERSAIREYEGGYDRGQAEALAYQETFGPGRTLTPEMKIAAQSLRNAGIPVEAATMEARS